MVDRTVMQSGRYKVYPEYKDSGVEWLGEIPSGWALTHLKFIASIFGRIGFRGYTVDDIVDEDEGAIVLSPSNIKGDKFCLEKKAYLSWKKYFESPEIMVEPSDILLVKTGSIGKSTIIQDVPEPMTVNPQMVLIKKSSLDSRFLAYLLNSSLIKAYIDVSNTGSGMPTMTQENINSFPMLYPPNRLDVKIANFLDYETAKIDTLIEKQQRLIELLTEKRQAVISHAVTKGLNPDVPMKDSGVEWLGEVPEHWEVKPLKYLVSEPLQYGANEAAIDTDISQPRFVRITDVLPNGDLKKDTFRSLSYEVAKPYMLKDGDVLLARSGGTVGKSFIYRDTWGKCCFAGYLIKARINESFIPAEWFYLNTLTDFYWSWIESIQIQATIQNVSADKYNAFFIAIPPISEAEEIIPYIEKNLNMFDALISKAEQAIQLMQERRTALISAAVTGKIDVRD